jgi:hypothetical protein
LTLAADAGLRVIVVLFSGHVCGTTWLPDWALDPHAGNGRSGDIYGGPLLDAQLTLAQTLGAALNDHPALASWDIGHEFSKLREPSQRKVSSGDHSQAPADEQRVAAWSRQLCAALHAPKHVALTAGTSSSDLLLDRAIRLGSLCAPLTYASMQSDNVSPTFGRGRLDPELLPFLAMLTAAFSFKPVLITGFGNPTCPPGKFSAFERAAAPGEPPHIPISPTDSVFATYPCLTEDENAYYCTAVLERLHADGRLGALWWCWSDYGDELTAQPRFDRTPQARTFGIIRADGSPKPVTAALSSFAARKLTVTKAVDMPMIASAYYYRTLPTSTATLYDAYLRFIADRRSGATA